MLGLVTGRVDLGMIVPRKFLQTLRRGCSRAIDVIMLRVHRTFGSKDGDPNPILRQPVSLLLRNTETTPSRKEGFWHNMYRDGKLAEVKPELWNGRNPEHQ